MSVTHQVVLPLPRLGLPRIRACRRPFVPSEPIGPYKLPQAVLDRLAPALAPFRNRDAAFALAVFLGRYWSAPKRLGLPFPVDRRALTDHAVLDLTEARVRGAIRTLEAIGFLDRADGSRRYKATTEGLHRRPILFAFGLEVREEFETANRRALAAAQRTTGGRRTSAGTKAPGPDPRLSPDPQVGQRLRSPKDTVSLEGALIMGEVGKGLAEQRMVAPIEPGSALEEALARLAAGVIGTVRRQS